MDEMLLLLSLGGGPLALALGGGLVLRFSGVPAGVETKDRRSHEQISSNYAEFHFVAASITRHFRRNFRRFFNNLCESSFYLI